MSCFHRGQEACQGGGVACGQDLGSELEMLEFQPGSATVSLCNPEQLTNTL